MRGVISPFPNTPSWRGVQFKKITGTILPLPTAVQEKSCTGILQE